MDFKTKYLLAKKNGMAERFRGEEIAKEISKTVPSNDQQALQTNMIEDLINGVPFSHQTEWEKYQLARANAKRVIDGKIDAIEAEIKEYERCLI